MKQNYNSNYFKSRDKLTLHIAKLIEKFAKKNQLNSILDIGCGSGKMVNFLQQGGFDAKGCDNSQIAIKLARNINKKSTIYLASATNLPFANESFDLILSISLIEHLSNKKIKTFLAQSKRVLKPNGFIFLITPNFATPIRLLKGKKWFAYQDPTHINFFTPKRLSKLLVKNGFKDPKNQFRVPYDPQIDNEFPTLFEKMPLFLKKLLIYLLFNSPLYIIRDSFWTSAQKK